MKKGKGGGGDVEREGGVQGVSSQGAVKTGQGSWAEGRVEETVGSCFSELGKGANPQMKSRDAKQMGK